MKALSVQELGENGSTSQASSSLIPLLRRYVSRSRWIPDIHSVILLGSYSRGDAEKESDIDLLVISENREAVMHLRDFLRNNVKLNRLNLIRYSTKTFHRLTRKQTLFMFHVFAEGRVLRDDGLFRASGNRNSAVSLSDLQLQWHIAKCRIEDLQDLSIYGHVFSDPLSRLYPLTKKICIVAVAFGGEFVFNRHLVYQAMIRKYPELSSPLKDLYELRPFALAWKRGIVEPLPFSPINCQKKLKRLLNHLNQVITKVEQNEPRTNSVRPF
jgi:predicted nucleotidyltransferase